MLPFIFIFHGVLWNFAGALKIWKKGYLFILISFCLAVVISILTVFLLSLLENTTLQHLYVWQSARLQFLPQSFYIKSSVIWVSCSSFAASLLSVTGWLQFILQFKLEAFNMIFYIWKLSDFWK